MHEKKKIGYRDIKIPRFFMMTLFVYDQILSCRIFMEKLDFTKRMAS